MKLSYNMEPEITFFLSLVFFLFDILNFYLFVIKVINFYVIYMFLDICFIILMVSKPFHWSTF